MNLAERTLTGSIAQLPVWGQALIGFGVVLASVGLYTVNEKTLNNHIVVWLSIIIGFFGFVVLLDALQ